MVCILSFTKILISVCLSISNRNYKSNGLFFFIIVFSLLSVASANAELYVWTDENGIQHFSNTAPPVELEKVGNQEEIDSSGISDGSAVNESKTDDNGLSGKKRKSNREGGEKNTFEKLKTLISDGIQDDKARALPEAINIINNSPEVALLKDDYGETLLHTAVGYHVEDIVLLLISKGADINAANQRGRTPIHDAIYDEKVLQLLISKGANVNAQDKKGQTPLHLNAMEKYSRDKHLKIAGILIQNNAQPSIKDKIGKTAAQYAAENNLTEMVTLLSEKQ